MLKALRTYLTKITIVINLVISHHFRLCSSHYLEVGGALLKRGDVTNVHAPIRIEQHKNQNNNVMTVAVGFFAQVAMEMPLSVKSDQPTQFSSSK